MCKVAYYPVKVYLGGKRVSIGAFWPSEFSQKGWSLARMQEQEDVREHSVFVEELRSAFRAMGVHVGYAAQSHRLQCGSC